MAAPVPEGESRCAGERNGEAYGRELYRDGRLLACRTSVRNGRAVGKYYEGGITPNQNDEHISVKKIHFLFLPRILSASHEEAPPDSPS